MEQKNVPLTREQIKALPVLKDSKGRPVPSYVPPYPTAREERLERKAIPHNNRKQNGARANQREEIVYRQPILEDGKPKLDKDGNPLYTVERTGYFKTIQHKLVKAKENRAYMKLMEKHEQKEAASKEAKDAGELSEHAKENS